ncbi:MAG: hypothetical protein ACOCTI_07620 [Phycisphaeraceae bacterium]
MNSRQRLVLWSAALLAILAGTAVWSLGRYRAAADRLDHAREQTREVASLVREIHALRSRPAANGGRELDEVRLGALLSDAAEAAGLDSRHAIRSIDAPRSRRLMEGRQETFYRQLQTEVQLDGVTMEQLFRFAHALASHNRGLRVSSVYLTSPQGASAAARWSLRPMVVSYLVYDPPEAGR